MTELMPLAVPLVTTHLWLRAEPNNDPRTPLTPETMAELLKPQGSPFVKIHVERSPHRCIADSEYESVGCELVPSASWMYAPTGSLIVGLSDIDEVKGSLIEHHHLCSSRVFKDEPGWGDALRQFLDGDCVLYDYANMVDEKFSPVLQPPDLASPLASSQKFSSQLLAPLSKFPAHSLFKSAENAFKAKAEPILRDPRYRKYRPHKVLLALDESQYSQYALKWACDNFIRRNDHVTILNVFDYTPIVSMDLDASLAEGKEVNDKLQLKGEKHAVHVLQKYAKRLLRAGMRPTLVLLKGPVKHCILEYLDDHPQDAIICGSRGMGAVKRIFLGSVSDHIARHVHAHHNGCAVTIVKEPDDLAGALAADKERDRQSTPAEDEQHVVQPGSSSH